MPPQYTGFNLFYLVPPVFIFFAISFWFLPVSRRRSFCRPFRLRSSLRFLHGSSSAVFRHSDFASSFFRSLTTRKNPLSSPSPDQIGNKPVAHVRECMRSPGGPRLSWSLIDLPAPSFISLQPELVLDDSRVSRSLAAKCSKPAEDDRYRIFLFSTEAAT